jgi:hypothetical protein
MEKNWGTDEIWRMGSVIRLALILSILALTFAWLTAPVPGGEKRYQQMTRLYFEGHDNR